MWVLQATRAYLLSAASVHRESNAVSGIEMGGRYVRYVLPWRCARLDVDTCLLLLAESDVEGSRGGHSDGPGWPPCFRSAKNGMAVLIKRFPGLPANEHEMS